MSETNSNAPRSHARYGLSGAKKYFECSGSLALERGLPDTPNEYSDDGTACHTVAAWCLTQHYQAIRRVGDWIVVSDPHEEERKVQFTADMAEVTQDYVDCVRKMAIGHTLYVEQRVEFSNFVATEDQFSTTDAAFVDWDNGELVVADAKFGHQPVPVEKNPQLSGYALATLGMLYEQAMAEEARKQTEEDGDDDLSA